jgi:hypothetical protein
VALKGAKTSPELASITGSFRAYRYTVELKPVRERTNLLDKITASKLLASYVDGQVLTVSDENGSSDGSDEKSTILALVNINLRTHEVKSKLGTYLSGVVKNIDSAVLKEPDLENRSVNLRGNLGESLACFLGEHEVSPVHFLLWRHYCRFR